MFLAKWFCHGNWKQLSSVVLQPLTINTILRAISAGNKFMIFFYLSPRTGFIISYNFVSLGAYLLEMSACFLGEIRKSFKMSSADFFSQHAVLKYFRKKN